MKNIGKPCTGKPYVRFDEGGQDYLLSTLPYRYLNCQVSPGSRIASAAVPSSQVLAEASLDNQLSQKAVLSALIIG